MAKAHCIIGRLCSGKTTYAGVLCGRERAVLLSIDEIMLALFGQHCGGMHDTYAERCKKYLLNKAVLLVKNGISVVLDWGPWKREERRAIRAFFADNGVETVFYYIDIGDDVWKARIKKRNRAVESGDGSAYYVDENLANKFLSRFEAPQRDEVDIWLDGERLTEL